MGERQGSLDLPVFFERMLERLPAGAYACDPEGLIVWFNESAVRLWGREPKKNDPSDRYCGSFRLSDPDGAPIDHSRCWMALALRENRAYEGREIVIERPTGERAHVLAYATPIYDDAGHQLGAINVLVDVGEQKRAEQALREADRRKDAFLAVLAHELRNPLAPIRNAVALLRIAGPPDPVLVEARDLIDRQVAQMSRLVDDLLDVARITHGRLGVKRERVALQDVVRNAIETARPLIDGAGQHLELALPPEPVLLDADPVRLAQVFLNLLSNAARFSEPGGRIALRAVRRGHEEAPGVVVSVRDQGRGIAAADLARIFEMFEQDRATSSESAQGGLGIGLSLVKALVALHGGSVEARSDGPGRGAEFRVALPVAGREAAPSPAPAPLLLAERARRVLIVDDNPDAAISLQALLDRVGHETRMAHCGADALAAGEDFVPEIVLLDIGLPDFDGFEVCRRLRRRPWGRRALVIAVTGWGREEHKQLSREAGFDHHLTKPVPPQDLIALLAEDEAS